MNNTLSLKEKKINYYPLMWILLSLSLLAVLSFAARSFVIQDYNGQSFVIYAHDLFSRNNTILNDSSFFMIRATILSGIILGIINISMSLWQVGYKNARKMKLLNSIRFSVTGLLLTLLVFVTDLTSGGNISIRDTLLGALGINCLIYFIAYLINLYYCSNKKLTIVNYKAISILLVSAGCAFWALSFLNVNGESIIGIKTIIVPSISFLNMSLPPLVNSLNNNTFIVFSQVFSLLYIYNIAWCLIYTMTNKSYRRHNIIRYLLSAGFSGYYAYYCISTFGSTIQGSIGIIGIAAIYLFLALYTIFAFKKLKYKIYSNVNEETIYDDDDQYYDVKTRFIDNPFPNYESNLISIDNNDELVNINDYDYNKNKVITGPSTLQEKKLSQSEYNQNKQIDESKSGKIDKKEFNNPILLVNNAPLQDRREVGDDYIQYDRASHYSEYRNLYYSKEKDNATPIKDINLDDIFISEKVSLEESEKIIKENAPVANISPNDMLAEQVPDLEKTYPKVIAYNNSNICESYVCTNKALHYDTSTENYIDYNALSHHKGSIDKIVKPKKERKFNITDFKPKIILSIVIDTFYSELNDANKSEFERLFVQDESLIFSRVPQYIINGDNTHFFSNIMAYIDLPCISVDLAYLIYQYVTNLYQKDIIFISKCNKKIIDFLYKRSRTNSSLLPTIRDICSKEIKLMLNNDILSTIPVIERLIRVYVKINAMDNALKLCDTIINFDLSSDINRSFNRLKSKIILLRNYT